MGTCPTQVQYPFIFRKYFSCQVSTRAVNTTAGGHEGVNRRTGGGNGAGEGENKQWAEVPFSWHPIRKLGDEKGCGLF